jgi:copper(I)-binding protein
MKMASIYAFIVLSFALAACGRAEQATVTATDIWGRPSPQAAANAAFYMSLENNIGSAVSLTGVTIPVCTSAELHETTIDDQSVMSMRHIASVTIPKGKSLQLEPGGYHIMCLGLQSELKPGDRIPITLTFADSGELQVEAVIREP